MVGKGMHLIGGRGAGVYRNCTALSVLFKFVFDLKRDRATNGKSAALTNRLVSRNSQEQIL